MSIDAYDGVKSDEAEFLPELPADARNESELTKEARDNEGVVVLVKSIEAKGTLDSEGERSAGCSFNLCLTNCVAPRLSWGEDLNLADQAFSLILWVSDPPGCSLAG